MPAKQAFAKAKSGNVFGHARNPAKTFRAGFHARVSTTDQQTLAMQNRAMRDYADCFSSVTVIGTPQGVMRQELRIECCLPAAQATAEASRQLAQSPG